MYEKKSEFYCEESLNHNHLLELDDSKVTIFIVFVSGRKYKDKKTREHDEKIRDCNKFILNHC